MPEEVTPFRIEVPDADLRDLRERLGRTRWPEAETVADWSQGVPLAYLRELCGYWAEAYDWRATEARLNALPQFRTELDGLGIHFLHVRSPHPGALPLVITHGWPGSVVEFLKVIGPLTDPTAHGGDAADAFHLVIPSLPGFGFSGPTSEPGWDAARTARAWAELMRRLGYDRYGAHGNDAGAIVAPHQGRVDPDHVVGVHVNQVFSFPSGDPAELAGLTPQELGYLAFLQGFVERAVHDKLQAAQPQTLAHALADSPAGQLAWSGQLFGDALSKDHVLTNVATYWLTNTAASAARFYYENHHADQPTAPTTVPMGLASFAFDFRPIRRFAQRDHANIVSWSEFDRGSHWAAHDAPDLLTSDLRQFFARLR